MNRPRSLHTATLLGDGNVLIAGGLSPTGFPEATFEVYDTFGNTFGSPGVLVLGRSYHSATLVDQDLVVIAGGRQTRRTFLGSGIDAFRACAGCDAGAAVRSFGDADRAAPHSGSGWTG